MEDDEWMRGEKNPFLKQVVLAFDNLIQSRGFHVVDDLYSPLHFGNAYVVLECEEFRVRLLRERGQHFAEIASRFEPENWHVLWHLLTLVTAKDCGEGEVSPEEAARLLQEKFELISDALNKENYAHTRKQLNQAYGRSLKKMFPTLTDDEVQALVRKAESR